MRTKASSLKLAAGKKSTSIFAPGRDSKAGRRTGKFYSEEREKVLSVF